MQTINFKELKISENIMKAVDDMGFEEATPIQTQAIPFLMEGLDIIGQAQTGTGKTAAFGIPLLEKISPNKRALQAMVICPTRELAIQVSDEIKKLSKYMKQVNVLPVYGGQPISRQMHALRKGVQVVVGTPGRVMDHMRRGTLDVTHINMIVLDEADEMLNMGFREDIETILKDTPADRQTAMFSATLPKPILQIAKKYLTDYKTIRVAHKELTVPKIRQTYIEVKQRNKFELLTRLVDINNPKLALVFCNTKRRVDEIVQELQGRGYFADGLHGDLKQSQRDRVMNNFRKGVIEILVATDVAARGIDVDDIEIVFNYDVPQDEEYYVHRIGRTGRAGREGQAITFAFGKEVYKLKSIERYAKTKIKREQMPSINDVAEARFNGLVQQVGHIVENENIRKETHMIEKLLEEDYSTLDVAAALLKMVMGEGKQEIKQENKYESRQESRRGGSSVKENGSEPGMARLFINIGKKQGVRPGDVVGAIAGETGMPGDLIGSIDIFDKYTFVEVPVKYADDVLRIMSRNTIKGQPIQIEPASEK
jgi:ATP-dependent RNA helicase DeaD